MDKISPTDPRVQSKTAKIRGKTYRYYQVEPTEGRTPRDTILLMHGFPDLAMTWRYQVPALAALGLRVIVPDMLGYGGTDAPVDIAHYSLKSLSDDMAALARHVVVGGDDVETPFQVLVAGHDWGCGVGWRMCLWHPDIVKAYVGISVPFWPAGNMTPQYVPLDTLATEVMPWWGYQLQIASGKLVAAVQTEAEMRDFINATMGASKGSEPMWVPEKGWNTSDYGSGLPRSPIFSEEEERYYLEQMMRHGLHPPTNYYRTWRINFLEEQELVANGIPKGGRFKMPVLFIAGTQDGALPAGMADGQEPNFEKFRSVFFECGHWVLVEKSQEVNKTITEWIEGEVYPSKASL